MQGSNILRSVSDAAGIGTPLVALTSLATTPQHVTVKCLNENGTSQVNTLELEPNQTLVGDVCTNGPISPMLSAADIAARNVEVYGRPGGILRGAVGFAIRTDGMPGGLAAFGITPHISPSDSFFSSFNFTDPKTRRSSGSVYTGIPVGPSPLLPTGEYEPEITLANFGPKDTSIAITSATTIAGMPKTKILAAFSLASGSVKTLKLGQIVPSPDLLNSVVIHSDGALGDVVTKLTSRSSTRLPIVEMLAKDETDAENGGGHPWTIEGGITSALLLFNHASAETDFNIRFSTPNGPWMKVFKLLPMETRAISINELIQNQEIDDEGRKLLMNTTSGEVGWQTGSSEVGGRVIQASPALAMARNFSCSNYITECNLTLTPDSVLAVALGQDGGLGTITPNWNLSHFGPSNSCTCGSTTTTAYIALNYGWWSGNTSIANVVSGQTTSSTKWQGMGAGSTVAYYQAQQNTYGGLTCQAQAPVRVGVPTKVAFVGENDHGQAVCGAGQAGFSRQITLQIVDQYGKPASVQNWSLSDIIQVVVPNVFGITGTQTGTITGIGGPWLDQYFICSTACPQSTGSASALQTWTANSAYALGSNSIVYKCGSITFDGN